MFNLFKKEKPTTYFCSHFFSDGSKYGFGTLIVTIPHKVKTSEDIFLIINKIKEANNFDQFALLNYKELEAV